MKINNKLLDEKSSICCKCTNSISSTSTDSYTQIPLTQQNIKGSNFYVSNNRIYARKSCTVVMLGQVYISGGISSTSTGVRVQLYKNGSVTNRILFSVPNNYRMIPLGGYQITMSAGDYIDMRFNSGDKSGITCGGGTDTYLTVTEV